MGSRELLEESLGAVAEADLDIVPRFFERFFEAHPEQRASFYNPRVTQGAMVNEMLDYLLALGVGETWVPHSVDSTVLAHHSYGNIPPETFDDAVDLLIETLAETAGDLWKPEYGAAWAVQADRMKAMIRHAC